MFTSHDKISLPPIDEPQAPPPIPPMRLFVVRRNAYPDAPQGGLPDVMLHAHMYDHHEGVLRFYDFVLEGDGIARTYMRRAFNVWVDVEEVISQAYTPASVN